MRKQTSSADIAQEIFRLLPADLRKHKEDLKRNIQAAVNARLVKMDLVTREEFDIQSELLSRTRALVDALQEEVRVLESRLEAEDR